jgi:(E)-2-((N-methylformamido)methylene)succinate hydrolase
MNLAAPARDGLTHGTRYRVSGEGAPVVLVHGVGMSLEMWDAVVERLGCRYRILRYDMLGHGGSAKPPGPYRLDDFVTQLTALTNELGLARFDLVGFSMGGLVAQAFAVAHGGRLGRLVLLNTVFDRNPAERSAIEARVRDVRAGGYAAGVDAALERWFTPSFRLAHPEVVAAVRRHMNANDMAAYAAAYTVFATADRELAQKVEGITVPTLVATGADDQRSTLEMARRLADRVPHAVCRIIDGQRHLTPIEVPDEVAALIDAFLSAEDGAPDKKAAS